MDGEMHEYTQQHAQVPLFSGLVPTSDQWALWVDQSERDARHANVMFSEVSLSFSPIYSSRSNLYFRYSVFFSPLIVVLLTATADQSD